jgi:DNA mismatch repair protein MutS
VEAGAADRSYGIHVARLAGVPRPVVDRATEILANLERDEYGGDGLPRRARKPGRGSDPGARRERSLFGVAPEPAPREAPDPAVAEVLAELRRQDPERLTPLEALALLDAWSRRLSRKPGP